MLPSETMIWQPEFTDKTLSRKPGAVQFESFSGRLVRIRADAPQSGQRNIATSPNVLLPLF
ncbi:hypothetical protein BMR61_24835 [Escherichia coli]|nr:hypothetical protein BMR61_24835 [Escherichia coli]